MVGNFEEFQEIARLKDAFNRAQVAHDLNNDMAGREVGRIQRVQFGSVGLAIERRKNKERLEQLMFRTALEALLADPVYRARHEAFGDFLDEYEAAAITALQRAIEISDAAHRAVQEALNTANMLDGRAVFVTADGRIVYADGSEINPAHADQIEWRVGATTYEEYLFLIEQAAVAEQAVDGIREYQNDLNAAQERHQSDDNPYRSVEEMDAAEARLISNAPDAIRRVVNEAEPVSMGRNSPLAAGKLTLPE